MEKNSYKMKVGAKCNNNCIFCKNLNIKADHEKSTSEIKNELNSLKSLGYEEIILPCNTDWRDDLFEILEFAKEKGMDIVLETNGKIFFYNEFCEKVKPFVNKIIICQFSKRGSGRDNIQSDRNDEHTESGVNNLLKSGIKTEYRKNNLDSSEKNKTVPNSKVAYYIGGIKNFHFISHIVPLLNALPGTVYSKSPEVLNILTERFPHLKCRHVDKRYNKNIFEYNQNLIRTVIELREEDYNAVIFFDHEPILNPVEFKSYKGKLKFIQLFHGTSDKEYITSEKNSLRIFDLFLVPGKRDYDRLMEFGLNARMIGSPKMDVIFKAKLNKNKIKKSYGLNREDKVVVYAPTWDNDKSMGQEFYSSFNFLIPQLFNYEIEDFKLIIKPHTNTFKYNMMINYAYSFLSKKNNIVLLNQEQSALNNFELLSIADILVTDISAISAEFLAFDKPLIFYNHQNIKDLVEEKNIWRCGDVVDNIPDLIKQIKLDLDNPKRHQKKREMMRREYYYKLDGNATKRAIEEIKKFMKEGH
jgi:hypothetical protein